MDYFIHKNLGGFLRRELDFYIKNEIIRLDDIEAADAPRVDDYLKKLRVLRKIARRIIDFLAQLEDFQKKLWLKKKFVIETQYCITLDRIPESFYPEIAANEQQREEWVKLFAIDQIEDNIAQTGYSAPLTINFLKENQFLVIDTSLFPEQFKHELISKLDKLDENTTGNLLHSDNQQGLNLISEKFKKDIDCIFIDPPYNTGNDGFIYKDAYCHSSWLSFARSRIEAAKPLLSESSYFGATIDLVESSRLKLLLDEIFSEESFLADIAWEKRYTRSNNAKKFYSLKDQLLVYGNVETFKERRTESSLDNYSNPDKDPRGDWISSSYVNPATREARPNLSYEIVNPYTQEKISHPTHAWKYDKQVHLQHVQDNRLYWGEAGDYTYPRLKSFLSEASENMVPVDIWKHQETGTTDAGGAELKSMFGKSVFDNPKPTSLISRFVRLVADNKEPRHVIDFFAGSGSTGHALINLSRQACNKKYTLIEMGAHFDSVLKPRLQKSIYSKDWNEGKPVSREGISHCLKYIRLESFEDTLNNLQLPDTPRLNVSATDSSEMARDYLLKYWLEFETTGSPSLLNVREFSDPTAYTLKVKQPGSDAQVEKTIDLVETFNWLIGLHVAHLDQPRRYAIELVRETDPELPQDQDTRWRATSIKEREDGEFWFRAVEGHVLRVPGDELSRERVLVIWRKLTGHSGRDQAALEAWLGKRGINPRESEFARIYVNGNHALPSDGEAALRVQLIEQTFAQRMWEDA